jgi:branched-chain amino acid transport system substrate-binding protein
MIKRRAFLWGSVAAVAGVGSTIAVRAQSSTFKIGVAAAMSGDAAGYGKPYLDAVRVAADEFNKEGGIGGRRIEVIYYDDRGIPDLALQAVKKLVLDDKVHALLPGGTSGAIFTSMPVGKDARTPMWSYGLAKQITTQGEGMIYRATPPDMVTIPALARFAHKRGYRRVGIIHVDHFYGEFVRDTFKHAFEAAGDGAKIVAAVSQPDGSRDVSSQLLSVARARPDCMYMGTNGSAFAPTLRQIRQFLPRNTPVLTDTELSYPNFRDELKDLANGAFYYNSKMADVNPDPLNQRWISILRERLGTYQEIMGRAPVGMAVLKEAVEKAGAVDGIAVMKQVHRMKNFPTMGGPFTYDPRDGEGIKSGIICEVVPGNDPSKDRIAESYDTVEPLYQERVNYTRFFGEGYREELYAYHGVS